MCSSLLGATTGLFFCTSDCCSCRLLNVQLCACGSRCAAQNTCAVSHLHEKPSKPTFRSHTWQRLRLLPGEEPREEGEDDSGEEDSSAPAEWGDDDTARDGAEAGDDTEAEAEADSREEADGMAMGALGAVLMEREKAEAGLAEGKGEAGTAGSAATGARTRSEVEAGGTVGVGVAGAGVDEAEGATDEAAEAEREDCASAAVRALVLLRAGAVVDTAAADDWVRSRAHLEQKLPVRGLPKKPQPAAHSTEAVGGAVGAGLGAVSLIMAEERELEAAEAKGWHEE